MKLGNKHNIHPSIGVWLADSQYNNGSDEIGTDKPIISATGLIRSVRQSILTSQINQGALGVTAPPDIADSIAANLGNAVHDAIERSWINSYQEGLQALGVPQSYIDKVVVNPEPGQISHDSIPIYLEKRLFKDLGDLVISGKFDMVYNGDLIDFKTTGTYSYTSNTKGEDYILQGSIYRWLNPDLITGDHIHITYLFKDWKAFAAKKDPRYPPSQILTVPYRLLSLEDTESWVRNRLRMYKDNYDKPQSEMVECSDKELWMDDTKFKYFSNPHKASIPGAVSTKNFSSQAEAITHMQTKGCGKIIEQKGTPRACGYCAAVTICEQAKRMKVI